MMKLKTTTIRLRLETKELLDKAKIIPEEPYDRVIVRALEALKKEDKAWKFNVLFAINLESWKKEAKAKE